MEVNIVAVGKCYLKQLYFVSGYKYFSGAKYRRLLLTHKLLGSNLEK